MAYDPTRPQYPLPEPSGPASGYPPVASPVGRRARPRSRVSRTRGCGCVLLILAILAAPFVGFALTTGHIHQVFGYMAGGMGVLLVLAILIGMLATKGGREALLEGIFSSIGGDS